MLIRFIIKSFIFRTSTLFKLKDDRGNIMFGHFRTNYEEQLRSEKERLNSMSEKELLIEMILELKRIDQKCDDIARKIVIWSN